MDDDARSRAGREGDATEAAGVSQSQPPQRQSEAAAAAAAAIARKAVPDRATYEALKRDLHSVVRRAVAVGQQQAQDIVNETIMKLWDASQDGRVVPDTALAYVRRIARNEAKTVIRRRRSTEEPLPQAELPATDDDIARLIAATACATDVEGFLRSAAERGDAVTTRVINAYLNLAASLRRDPKSREVAAAAQVSHTTVLDVLRRLRRDLDDPKDL